MGRASFLQADIERVLRAAAKTNSVVQVDLQNLVVTIVPGAAASVKILQFASTVPDGAENWDGDEPATQARQSARQADHDRERALLKKLGVEEYSKRLKQQHAEWAADLPNQPLDKRERLVLDQLARRGIGVRVHCRDVKQLGPGTEERLRLRGFIKNSFQQKFPDRWFEFWITEKGFAAWKELASI